MAMQAYHGVVQDSTGRALAGQSVTVRIRSTGAVATLYSTEAGAALTNPLTTDVNGRFSFYAQDNRYNVVTADSSIDDVMLYAGVGNNQIIAKASDEDVNNSDVLQNDDDFTFSIGASEKWAFTISVPLTSVAAAGFKYKFTIPAGVTRSHKSTVIYDTAAIIFSGVDDMDATTDYAGGVALAADLLQIHAYIHNGTTAGTVTMQWAQSTADASNTRLHQDGWMDLRRVF